MVGFEKDMLICLKPIDHPTRNGETHAYFPFLMSCLGAIEYLARLRSGCRPNSGVPMQEVEAFIREHIPDLQAVIGLLFEAIRHPVAHRGIASGVTVIKDKSGNVQGRFTWRITESNARPSVQVRKECGVLD